jgi:hypothetical protein
MKVTQVPGEPTRYYVESSSLECGRCKKTQSRRETGKKMLAAGDGCPACKQGVLQDRWHLVDLACFRPIGQCSCEHFAFRLQANLAKIPPSQLYKLTQNEAARLRCSHIEAARALALDLTLNQHVKTQERLGKAPGHHAHGVGA